MATSLVYDRSALAGFFSTPEARREKFLRERLLPALKVTKTQANGRVHKRGRQADIEGSIEFGHSADPRTMPPRTATSVTYDCMPYGLTDRVPLDLDSMQTALGQGGLVDLAIKDIELEILKRKDEDLVALILATAWDFDAAPGITWDNATTAKPLDDLDALFDSVDDANVMALGVAALNLLRRTDQFTQAMPNAVFGNPSNKALAGYLEERYGVPVIVPRGKDGAGAFIMEDDVFVAHIEPGYSNPRGGVNGSSALLRPEVLPLGAELWRNPLPGAEGAMEIKVSGWEDMIAVSTELGALLHTVDGS